MLHFLSYPTTTDNFGMTFIPTRIYLRINAFSSEGFASLVPSGNCRSILKRRQALLQMKRAMTLSQTLKLYQYQQSQRCRALLNSSPPSSEVSKYRDPLHILQDYIAEVSPAVLVFCHCPVHAPDLDVIYTAGT
jgi:hypothetical protein